MAKVTTATCLAIRRYKPNWSHFAFVTNNLDALMERLKEAGFTPEKSGADEPYRKNIYYLDPAGFEVEFVEYLSDVPSQRNLSGDVAQQAAA